MSTSSHSTPPPIEAPLAADGPEGKDAEKAAATPDQHAPTPNDDFCVKIPTVSWYRQFIALLFYKNLPLLSRKPVLLFLMLFSSVGSVLLAWPAGRDLPSDTIYPEPTDCGTIPYNFFDDMDYNDEKVALSYNDNWRSGVPVAVLSLGPMVMAICVYLIVHEEIQMHLFGVLRGLGMLDSVYWAAWYLPFAGIALVNSLFAAITAKLLPVHIFETTYFMGIFGSFFFVQLALIASSFFLAAVSGTARRIAVLLILCMIVAVWIPWIVMTAQGIGGIFNNNARDITEGYAHNTPTGLFWVNRQTTFAKGDNNTECNLPILSEQEGKFFKTAAERELVAPDQFFLGCYAAAGWGATAWAPPSQKTRAGIAAHFFFPYFHFNTVWGNFAGFTGAIQGAEFSLKHASMKTGELAREALPVPPNESYALGTSLFPQGSMLQLSTVYTDDCEVEQEIDGYKYCQQYKSNCPSANLTGDFNFCSSYLQPGSQCTTAPDPSPAEGHSVNAMFGFLTALSALYLLMTIYWGIVSIGGPGTHPFYFFLTPRFWFGTKSEFEACDDGDEEGGNRSRRASITGAGAVTVEGLKKSYGAVEAIKGVSMQMGRGEVTALLGHNGAGKTTLSNVLTCEVLPSEGDITVFGHSVKNDPYAIRRLVGVCKQDDYLWPILNAREQLYLFAGLRGVDPKDQPAIVQKWLKSVDLDMVQLQFSSQFSGGMKRRLSLALATIGGRPLIVLDEPTTGMDPVSRRFVWKHIEEIKQDRVVLLTTHAMEEADLLSDMVAIMRKGEIAAWGSPLQLKAEHGSVLQFSVLVDKEDTTTATQHIRKHFALARNWAKIDSGDAGNITIIIQKIQENEEDQGVPVETLSSFVAWLEAPGSNVSEYGFSNSSLEEVFLRVTEGDVEEVINQASSDQPIENLENEQHATIVTNASTLSGQHLASFSPKLTLRTQTLAIFWQNFIRNWTGSRSVGTWVVYGIFIFGSTMLGFLFARIPDRVPCMMVPVAFASFILLSVCSSIYADREEGMFYLMSSEGLMPKSFLAGIALYALVEALVYCIILLSLLYATPLFREPRLCEGVFCESKFGDSPFADAFPVQNFYGEFEGQEVLISAYSTPGGYGLLILAGVFFALTMPGAALASSYLPGQKKLALVVIAFVSLMASITPLFVYLKDLVLNTELIECFNDIVHNFDDVCTQVFDASTTNEDFLNCLGLQINLQQHASYCLPAYVGLLPQFGLFQTLSMLLIGKIKFVSSTPEYVEKVLIPSIQGGQCSGSTCTLPFAAKLYWEVLGFEAAGAVILFILGLTLAHLFAFPAPWVLHVKSRVTHALKWVRCQLSRKNDSEMVTDKTELEEVSKERVAVNNIIQPLLAKLSDDNSADQDPVIADHSTIPRDDLPPILMHKLRKVYPSFGGLPPKVALNSLDLHVPKGQVLGLLGKNGAGKTTALKILSAAHDATSGVGLVAGYDVSCERISVFERLGNCPQFDVVWPKLSVKEHLVFFAKLKGLPRNQLHTACRNIATAVGLGGDTVYNRQAGSLSGGMRRRLSIAISLIGAPKSLLLDEPTTGLDPSTRNNIWGLINTFSTDERAIIITTHMMVEADTLCNRIAIVAKGELVVVGTQQHLKNRFGSGYVLQLNLVKSTPQNQEAAMDFARKHLHKDATLGTKQAKTLHISLPRDFDLQRGFEALYSPEIRPDCINQFLLSQSSLEDVFIALGD